MLHDVLKRIMGFGVRQLSVHVVAFLTNICVISGKLLHNLMYLRFLIYKAVITVKPTS